MKTCPICQKSFSDGEMFCPECGEKLINPSAPPSETPALTLTPEPAEPVKEAEAPVPPPAEEPAAAETPAEPAPEDRPEPGPVEPPPPEKPPRGKRPVGVWRRILAVLLCVPLLLLLLAPTLGFEVRRTATEEGLRAALEDTSIAALPAAQLFDDVDDPALSFSDPASLNEYFSFLSGLSGLQLFMIYYLFAYDLIRIGLMLVIGFTFNRLYFNHCKKQINKIKDQYASKDEAENKLQTKGGVNTAIAVALFISFAAVNYLPMILYNFL